MHRVRSLLLGFCYIYRHSWSVKSVPILANLSPVLCFCFGAGEGRRRLKECTVEEVQVRKKQRKQMKYFKCELSWK